MKSCLVVDDSKVIRKVARHILETLEFSVEEAGDGKEALERCEHAMPDVVLLDIDLQSGPNGLHLGHILAQTNPDIAQVFLTKLADASEADGEYHELPEGAGFVRKHMVGDTDYLISVIDQVCAGKRLDERGAAAADPFLDLAPKAMQVLELLADGYSNQYIADALNVTTKAVERWIDVIYKTLRVQPGSGRNPRVEAAVLFHRHMLARETTEDATPASA